jgi:hypothetical protein
MDMICSRFAGVQQGLAIERAVALKGLRGTVFVAIPLETFVHSLRTMVGLLGIALLQALALLLRLLGNASRHLGGIAQRLYDLPLFVPLWIETRMRGPASQGARAASTMADESWKEART